MACPALVSLPSDAYVNLSAIASARWTKWPQEGHERSLRVTYLSGAVEYIGDEDADMLRGCMVEAAIGFMTSLQREVQPCCPSS